MTTDDYTKIDVVSVDNNTHNLIEWMKKSINDSNRAEFNRYVSKMYLDIDKKNKSITMSFPSYDEQQLTAYVESIISSAIAVGFEIYVKEQNNGK